MKIKQHLSNEHALKESALVLHLDEVRLWCTPTAPSCCRVRCFEELPKRPRRLVAAARRVNELL